MVEVLFSQLARKGVRIEFEANAVVFIEVVFFRRKNLIRFVQGVLQ
jgi:hypothetical protein